MDREQGKKSKSWRQWLFRIVAVVVIPALFFILLEAGLRIFGTGFHTDLTVKCEVNGSDAFCENNKFSWQFFPPRLARSPISFVIPAVKLPKTYRIFVLGGSAAQGDPQPSFSFGRILQVMLRDQFPSVNFEVVNTAIVATNSHVALKIAKDLIRHEPDLFIVYLGNNEVLGPFGSGTVFTSFSPNLSFIRASIILKTTRVGQLLGNLIQLTGAEENTPEYWGGIEMFLDKQVRADEPNMEHVYSHFMQNLSDIIRVARESGIKTIVSTVATNVKDSAPFASLHCRDMTDEITREWNTIYQSGIKLESEARYAAAIQRYLEAGRLDNCYADLHYRLARCYWQLGNYDSARDRYIQARDLDTLRFRADTKINDIIRSAAGGSSAEGAYLVDAVKDFEENSVEGIPGNDLFYEHVHMNFKGNYVLAKSVFQQVTNILPHWVLQAKKNLQLLTEDECAQRLAFSGYDRFEITAELQRRLGAPPFTNQLNHEEQADQLQKNLDNLKEYMSPGALNGIEAAYRRALEHNESDWWLHYNYAVLLQKNQKPGFAVEHFRIFLRHMPQYATAYVTLAKSLVLLGRFDEAIAQCNKALQIKPDYYTADYTIAFALAKLGKLDQSIERYKKLLSADPEMSVDVYNQIGLILIEQGNYKEAAKTFQSAVTLNADSENNNIPDVHYNFSYVLKRLGRLSEASHELNKAVEEYRKELDRRPRSSAIQGALGSAFVESKDFIQAALHFQQAVDLEPENVNNHFNLIKAFEVQGRFVEAFEASQKGIRFMLQSGRYEEAERLRGYLKSLELKKLRRKTD